MFETNLIWKLKSLASFQVLNYFWAQYQGVEISAFDVAGLFLPALCIITLYFENSRAFIALFCLFSHAFFIVCILWFCTGFVVCALWRVLCGECFVLCGACIVMVALWCLPCWEIFVTCPSSRLLCHPCFVAHTLPHVLCLKQGGILSGSATDRNF